MLYGSRNWIQDPDLDPGALLSGEGSMCVDDTI